MSTRRKTTPPPPPPLDPELQREMMDLVKSGFDHRASIETQEQKGTAQPPAHEEGHTATASPGLTAAPLLPLIKPQPRPKERTGKRNDPDYKPFSTYLLKCLDQRLKIVAARLDVDASDLVNQAVFEFLEGFEEGFTGTGEDKA